MYTPKQKITDENPIILEPNAWEIRANRRISLIREYMRNFVERSSIWQQAMNEGWSTALYAFVHSIADVQAQMIVEEKHIGWSGVDIFGTSKITDVQKRQFFSDQRRQAEKMEIDIAIPTGRIEQMRRMASMMKVEAA